MSGLVLSRAPVHCTIPLAIKRGASPRLTVPQCSKRGCIKTTSPALPGGGVKGGRGKAKGQGWVSANTREV